MNITRRHDKTGDKKLHLFNPTPKPFPPFSTENLYPLIQGSASISLHFHPPHSASVDFADRMIIDTRNHNHEHGSQTRKLVVMQTNTPQF